MAKKNKKINDLYYFHAYASAQVPSEIYVMVVSKKFWDENRCLSDQHISAYPPLDKMIPNGCSETMESVFETSFKTVEEVEAAWKLNGFLQDAGFTAWASKHHML